MGPLVRSLLLLRLLVAQPRQVSALNFWLLTVERQTSTPPFRSQVQTNIASSANIASRAAFPRSAGEPKFVPIGIFNFGTLQYE